MLAKDKLFDKLNFRSSLSTYIGQNLIEGNRDAGLDKFAKVGFNTGTRLIFMNKDIVVFTALKYGKQVFEHYLNDGKPGTLYRVNDDLSFPLISWRSTIDPSMTREQAQANINNLFSSSHDKRLKLFLIRDPLEKLASAIIQLAFHSGDLYVKETLFNTALRDFEKFSPKDHKIISTLLTKADNRLKGFKKVWDGSNLDTSTNSPAYNSMKEYFKFVLTNFSYILLNDPHISSLTNLNTLYLLNTTVNGIKHQGKVFIGNLDTKKDIDNDFSFVNYIYTKYKISEKRGLKIDSAARHSTYRFKSIVKEALRELDINSYAPYFYIMSKEYYGLNEINRKYKHLIFKPLQ